MARNVSHTITFTFQGVDKLSDVANTANNSIKNLANGFNNLARRTSSVSGSTKNVEALFQTLNTVAGQLASTLKPVAYAVAGANRLLGDSMDGVAQSATGQKGSLKQLAGAYNALIVAKRGAQMMAAAVKPAADMEQAVMELGVATGLSAENMEKLRVTAMDVAQKTLFTPVEAVKAAKDLNLVVRDTTATQQAMMPVLQLAQTYLGKDVPAATKLAAKTMGAFGLQATDLAPTMDKLAAGALAVGVPVDQLTGGMGKLGVAAQLVGSNFEDIMPAYYMAIKGGLASEEAATGLKTAMGRLTDPKIAAQLEKGLGLTITTGGAFSSVRDVMVGLADAAAKHGNNWVFMGNQIRLAFGDRAVKPIIANIRRMNEGLVDQNGKVLKGAAAYDYVTESMTNSSGMLRDMSEVAMGTLTARVELLTEAWSQLAVSAFQPFLSIIGKLASAGKWLADTLRGLYDSTMLGPIFQSLTSTLGGLAGVMGTVVGAGLAIGGASRITSVAMGFLTDRATAASRALMFVNDNLRAGMVAVANMLGPTTRLGRAFTVMGASGRAAWRGILGPIALVLIAIEALPKAFALYQELWGSKEAKGGKEYQYAYLAGKAMANGARQAEAVMGAMVAGTEALNIAIKSAADLEKAKLPMGAGEAFSVMPKIANALKARSESDEGKAQVNQWLKDISVAEQEYRAGIMNAQHVEAAKLAMGKMTLAAKGMPGFIPADTLKKLDATVTSLENAFTGKGGGREIASALLAAGVHVKAIQQTTSVALQQATGRRAEAAGRWSSSEKDIAESMNVDVPTLRKLAAAKGVDVGSFAMTAAKEGKYAPPGLLAKRDEMTGRESRYKRYADADYEGRRLKWSIKADLFGAKRKALDEEIKAKTTVIPELQRGALARAGKERLAAITDVSRETGLITGIEGYQGKELSKHFPQVPTAGVLGAGKAVLDTLGETVASPILSIFGKAPPPSGAPAVDEQAAFLRTMTEGSKAMQSMAEQSRKNPPQTNVYINVGTDEDGKTDVTARSSNPGANIVKGGGGPSSRQVGP